MASAGLIFAKQLFLARDRRELDLRFKHRDFTYVPGRYEPCLPRCSLADKCARELCRRQEINVRRIRWSRGCVVARILLYLGQSTSHSYSSGFVTRPWRQPQGNALVVT